MTVQLFIPCYVDHFAPQVAHALTRLLDRLKIPWTYPAGQTCCGQFAYKTGDWTSARGLMRHFIEVFDGEGPILCPSASCVLTIRSHYSQLVQSPPEAARLQRLQSRVQEFSQWLAPHLPLPLSFPRRVFLHQSCAARQLGILPHVEKLLNQVAGLHLLKLSPPPSCCGFGGLFSLNQPHLSQAIGIQYVQTILETGAEALVSPDVGCLLHLRSLLSTLRPDFPVYHLAELMNLALHEP